MSSEERTVTTRRKLLAASGSAAILGIAGCASGDDETEDNAGTEERTETPGSDEMNSDESTVSLLAEIVGGDHDHEGEHEHEEEEGEQHEGVSAALLDEACGHMEFDTPEVVAAGTSEDDATAIEDTHQPFDISFGGSSGYVVYAIGHEEEDEHHDGEHEDGDHEDEESQKVAFFTSGGTATPINGEIHHETSSVSDCGAIDSYIVVEPANDHVELELSSA